MAINLDPEESRHGKMGNWVGSIVSWFGQGDPGHYDGRVEQDGQEIIQQAVESNRTTDDKNK
jgi:hypothetical protein